MHCMRFYCIVQVIVFRKITFVTRTLIVRMVKTKNIVSDWSIHHNTSNINSQYNNRKKMFINNYYCSDGYRQVIEQTYGVWHTKCYPRPHHPTDEEIREICKKVGYHDTSKATGRVVHDSGNALLKNHTANARILICVYFHIYRYCGTT